MANILKMDKTILIEQLLKLGWSYRQIERETGIRRETIAKYDPRRLKPAKVPTECPAVVENRPKCPPGEPDTSISSFSPSPTRLPTRVSNAAIYAEQITQKLELGLSAQRIYQDLVADFAFKGSYDCVKRFVRKFKKRTPHLVGHMHALPGEEAQVDFGRGAPVLRNGRYQRPWFFKMVLSYSRHSYEEVVWKQDVETFIRCHEHAFAEFGGVPAVIRYDNLKSGVLDANLFEPELNPLYAEFAKHTGFVPLPCLPRKPEHKGKTESGVGYTKDNALKGLKFESLEAENAHLRNWNKNVARTRIHGTTKRQVWAVFINEEKPALKPLPATAFVYFQIGQRTVLDDGHIEVKGAYYSVSYKLIGQRVQVRFNAETVKVLLKDQVVAFHRTIEPGRFSTNKEHLPEGFCRTMEETKRYLLSRLAEIGPHCQQAGQEIILARGQLGFRAIRGILQLYKKYSADTLEQACYQARQIHSVRYHTIKALCENRQYDLDLDDGKTAFLQHHEIIRPPQEYQHYAQSLQQLTEQGE